MDFEKSDPLYIYIYISYWTITYINIYYYAPLERSISSFSLSKSKMFEKIN